MGAKHGTLTYTTYYVVEEPAEGFKDHLIAAIQKHAFRDIDIDAGKDRSIGWVALGEPFDLDLDWSKLYIEPYLCLSLREDVIKIPKTAFQAHLDRREKEQMKKMGRDTLKKSERAEIKEVVLNELRKRALPNINTYDVVWNTADGTMRFFSQSKAIRESFEEIIHDSWGLRLVARAPYTILAVRPETAEMAGKLLDLEPADFVGVTE